MATPDYSGGLSSAISPDSKSSRSAATVVPPYSAAVGGVASGQMAREMGAFVPGGAPRLAGATRARAACARMRAGKREEGAGRGLLGKLRDALVRPIVAVPGGAKANAQLLDCVFCKGSGRNECTGCRGSGRDALGKCLMCDGWYVGRWGRRGRRL